MKDSPFCFGHDPAMKDKHLAAVSKGGSALKRRVLEASKLPGELKTTADVLTLLGRLIGHTLTGEVDPKIATSVGYLAGIFLKALEQVELGERVEAIERIILERKLIHTKGGVR